MVFIVVAMIAFTVYAAFWLARQSAPQEVHFSASPDRPCAFGYGMAWLAIRSAQLPPRLSRRCALSSPCPATGIWASAPSTTSGSAPPHLFVTPPVGDWTFVVGQPLPHPVGRGFVDKCTPLLVDLGGRFPEVQYFFSYPPIDFYAWARVRDGRLVRAFAVTDEGIVWNKGRTTKEERGQGLKLFELRGVQERKGDAGGEELYPTEEHVMRLAQPLEPRSDDARQRRGEAGPRPRHRSPCGVALRARAQDRLT